MSQYLPTSNFKWMSDKKIKQIDLGKYKADGKKGLILEVDLEYHQELWTHPKGFCLIVLKRFAVG